VGEGVKVVLEGKDILGAGFVRDCRRFGRDANLCLSGMPFALESAAIALSVAVDRETAPNCASCDPETSCRSVNIWPVS
jgi:hypothetical protein